MVDLQRCAIYSTLVCASILSGVQQSESIICIHISILFLVLFPQRSLQSIELSSLHYTAGPYQLPILYIVVCICQGFPGGSLVRNSPAYVENTGDMVQIPGSGRSLGGGHGNPLEYSCLENPMDREAWWVIESDTTEATQHPVKL